MRMMSTRCWPSVGWRRCGLMRSLGNRRRWWVARSLGNRRRRWVAAACTVGDRRCSRTGARGRDMASAVIRAAAWRAEAAYMALGPSNAATGAAILEARGAGGHTRHTPADSRRSRRSRSSPYAGRHWDGRRAGAGAGAGAGPRRGRHTNGNHTDACRYAAACGRGWRRCLRGRSTGSSYPSGFGRSSCVRKRRR